MKLPELILTTTNGLSKSIEFSSSVFSVGRIFVHDELGISDPTLSRYHCQIRWKSRNFWVQDGSAEGVSSLTGTFLDGKRLPAKQWVPVPERATLKLGNTSIALQHDKSASTDFDLMISYSRKDEVPVLEIYNDMLNMGLRPWMDQKSQQPAAHFKKEIEQVIAEVRAVAIFWGGCSMGDVHAAEVEIITDLYIHKKIKNLFLAVLPGSENPEWGLFLNNIDYYDMRKSGELQRFRDDLSKKLLTDGRPADG